MNDKHYNGFNNGRDTTDGVGGQPVPSEEFISQIKDNTVKEKIRIRIDRCDNHKYFYAGWIGREVDVVSEMGEYYGILSENGSLGYIPKEHCSVISENFATEPADDSILNKSDELEPTILSSKAHLKKRLDYLLTQN